MSKIYVGTLNVVKLRACEMVLKDYEIIGCNSDSQVGIQPTNDKETLQGAINRAKNIPVKGIKIGLEAGLQEMMGVLYLVNWGALIDEAGNIFTAGGTRIPLPDIVREKLVNKDTELAVVMDDYYKTNDIKHKEGAIGFFTNNLVMRVDIFTHIVKLLYGQYLNKNNIKN